MVGIVMTPDSYFVEKLIARCKERGTTPYFVALDCGIEPSLMSAIVNGKRKPKPDTWHQLLKKLTSSSLLATDLHTLIHWKAIDDYGPDAVAPGATSVEEAAAGHARQSSGSAATAATPASKAPPCRGYVLAAGSNGKSADVEPPSEPRYYELLPANVDPDELFCLSVHGDLMAPRFEEGGTLLLRPARSFLPNKFYVHESRGRKRTFKLYQLSVSKEELVGLTAQDEPVSMKGINLSQIFEVVEYKKAYHQ